MARTALTVNTATSSAITVTSNLEAGTADGHKFTNADENVCLLVNNTDGANSRTLVVPTPASVGGGAMGIDDETIAVAASNWVIVGPFENRYFQQSDGFVYVNFSDGGNESDLEVYAFKVPKAL